MKSPVIKKQRTIKVKKENGEIDIIKIIVSRITRQANFMGWNIKVNDQKYFSNELEIEKAFDKGFVKYIKENR